MVFTLRDFLQIALYIGALVVLTPLLGSYMVKVFAGEKHFLSTLLGWLERALLRLCGVDERAAMTWKGSTWAMLLFNFFGSGHGPRWGNNSHLRLATDRQKKSGAEK